MSTEPGEMRPRHVDRTIGRGRDRYRFMVGELSVRAARPAIALESADQRQRMIGTARSPVATAIDRTAEPQGHILSFIAEAAEIGRAAVGTERHRGITPEIVGSGATTVRVVRERRDTGNETVGQRWRPRLAAVEGGIHAAAVIVIPVVVARDHVERIHGIDGERRLVLRGGIIADVDDFDRSARRQGATEARRPGGREFVTAAYKCARSRERTNGPRNPSHATSP